MTASLSWKNGCRISAVLAGTVCLFVVAIVIRFNRDRSQTFLFADNMFDSGQIFFG